MKRILHHIIIPAIMPTALFVVASTPVEVLGCRARGLIALLIALTSGLAALGAAIMGAKGRVRGDTNAIQRSEKELKLRLFPVTPLQLGQK